MSGSVKKIMFTIAGAEISILTAKYAICIAKALGADLYGLYVVNMKALDGLLRANVFVQEEELEYENELEEQGKRYLKNIQELAEPKGVKIVSVLAKGIVHEEVVKKIQELEIDMLVMGELKELTSRRDSFYDEGERIFRETKCPVLVAKDAKRIERMYEEL